MNTLYLVIGPVAFRMHAENELVVHEDCGNFFHEEAPQDMPLIDCGIRVLPEIQAPTGKVVHQSPSRIVLEDEQGRETRLNLYGDQLDGIYRELDDSHIQIEILGQETHAVHLTTYFLELLALDKWLLRCQALVLHSAFIEWEGRAILFTAPSGTGKSTQARLWGEYMGVETINGDRSIVHQLPDGTFQVHGLPFCGSSQIHLDRQMPLGAIVFIEQAPENEATRMVPSQAYSKLYGEMSINSWNRSAVEESLKIIGDLVGSAPMVRLKCTISQEAVLALRNYLRK